MYHQWFNSVKFGEKEASLLKAIKDLGSKPIPYGEQPNFDKKLEAFINASNDYVEFCKNGHQKEVEIQNSLSK